MPTKKTTRRPARKSNRPPPSTVRACSARGRALKRTGSASAASKLARYCPPGARRKPNGRVRSSPLGGSSGAAAHLDSWRESIPRGTKLYAVKRRESRDGYRSVAEFVFVNNTGAIHNVPANASIMAGFKYDFPDVGPGGVVLPNGAGSIQDYVEAVATLLYGDPRALRTPNGYL